MDLLSPSFGVFFWQFITVFVVLVILKAFAFKNIVKSLDDRKKRIDDLILNSEEVKKKMLNMETMESELSVRLMKKKEEMLADIQVLRNEMLKKLKVEEGVEREKMLKRLDDEEREKRIQFESECYKKAALISLNLSKRMLMKGLDNNEKQSVFLDSLVNEYSVILNEVC